MATLQQIIFKFVFACLTDSVECFQAAVCLFGKYGQNTKFTLSINAVELKNKEGETFGHTPTVRYFSFRFIHVIKLYVRLVVETDDNM